MAQRSYEFCRGYLKYISSEGKEYNNPYSHWRETPNSPHVSYEKFKEWEAGWNLAASGGSINNNILKNSGLFLDVPGSNRSMDLEEWYEEKVSYNSEGWDWSFDEYYGY